MVIGNKKVLIRPTKLENQMEQVKVRFSFEIFHPKPAIYRGVKASDGGIRMEKRGSQQKKLNPLCGAYQKKASMTTEKRY
jgi:hypothetical protein